MKPVMSKFFRCQPDKITLVPTIGGVVVIALSVAMTFARQAPWLNILLIDFAMVTVVGILFPLLYIVRTGNDWPAFGLTFERWYVFLPINLVLGILMFSIFMSRSALPASLCLSILIQWQMAYIMLTGIF